MAGSSWICTSPILSPPLEKDHFVLCPGHHSCGSQKSDIWDQTWSHLSWYLTLSPLHQILPNHIQTCFRVSHLIYKSEAQKRGSRKEKIKNPKSLPLPGPIFLSSPASGASQSIISSVAHTNLPTSSPLVQCSTHRNLASAYHVSAKLLLLRSLMISHYVSTVMCHIRAFQSMKDRINDGGPIRWTWKVPIT